MAEIHLTGTATVFKKKKKCTACHKLSRVDSTGKCSKCRTDSSIGK